MAEVNALGQTLREQRMGAIDSSNLLAKVMAAIDVAIIGFDDEKRVRVLNCASERLLGGKLIGAAVGELGLGDLLGGEVPRIVELDRRGEKRQYLLRRAEARIGGRPHTLIVLTDVQRALRQEEQSAWQRPERLRHRPGAVPPDHRRPRRPAHPGRPRRKTRLSRPHSPAQR